MIRRVARPPDSVDELCLARVGLQARGLSATFHVRRLIRSMEEASARAMANGAGLLHAESFRLSWSHRGMLQYWSSFDALDAWSRSEPHADWWRAAVERMRTRGDLGVYHETFLVPRARLESIYVDCHAPVGILAFGSLGEPTGADTTSRGRLGLAGRP